MTERSKRNLALGVAAIAIGLLYGGVEGFYLVEFGEHSEYFGGWWIAVLNSVLGTFLLVRYRSARVRRFSRRVYESPYYKAFWMLASLAFAGFGAWLAVLVWPDLDSEGALGVFGFGVFFGIVGLALAGLWVRRRRHA